MAYLAASLKRLFGELDVIWPGRDRRTDGWIRWPKDGISVGHNPDSKGCVHAIDVDKDGIDQMWIINNIYKNTNVLWYVIWNRGIWSNTWGFTRHDYTGSNPHTDHMHIEIRQTSTAENWSGSWLGVNASGGSVVGGAAGAITGGPAQQGIGAADDRDPRSYMDVISWSSNTYGNGLEDLAKYTLDTLNM